jgi:hypothetical protein
MSRYFSRLAQRSGLMPPANVRTSAANSNDIVEHESQIDAVGPTSVSPVSASQTAPATISSTRSLERAPLQVSPQTAVSGTSAPRVGSVTPTSMNESTIVESAASTTSAASPTTSRTSSPMQRTKAVRRETRAMEASVPELFRESSVSNHAAPSSESDTSLTAFSARTVPGTRAVTTSFVEAESGRTPLRPIDASPSSAIAPASFETIVSAPLVRAVAPELSQEPRPATTNDAPMSVSAHSFVSSPSVPLPAPMVQNNSPSNDINVRIGAVRLEIHSPSPSAPVAAPPPAPATHAPRFTPRRHYLRG